MTERYNVVDEKKIREGLNELMKYKVNSVLDHGGPFTLAMAGESYYAALEIAQSWIDCREYENKIKEFENEVNEVNKLEKGVK